MNMNVYEFAISRLIPQALIIIVIIRFVLFGLSIIFTMAFLARILSGAEELLKSEKSPVRVRSCTVRELCSPCDSLDLDQCGRAGGVCSEPARLG